MDKELFACPACHKGLMRKADAFVCSECSREYAITGGIPDFRAKPAYWCNVRREKMRELIEDSKSGGDWRKSVAKLIPQYAAHVDCYDRADAQFMLPIDADSRVLDAGSMWGGLTVPIAQYCKEMVALDQTMETLEFLKVRCDEERITNIRMVASPIKSLPFADGYFDAVVVNGVLEWAGFDEELILEKHWGKRRDSRVKYRGSPRDAQLKVLNEIRRVLKPGGHLFLAIENRFGYQYFLGEPDDHVNIRFLPILPRFMADWITRIMINSEYRTYIYSLGELDRLLSESSFGTKKFYGVFPHYIMPHAIVPVEFVDRWFGRLVKPVQRYRKAILKLFPKAALKYFSPSFIVVSNKGGKEIEPRIARIVRGLKIAGTGSEKLEVVKAGGRPGNFLSSNFIIYTGDGKTPLLFCKVCRDKTRTGIVLDEYENLKKVHKLLGGTKFSKSVPEAVYCGKAEGITILVTRYKTGNVKEIDVTDYFDFKNFVKESSSFVRRAVEELVSFQKETAVGNTGIRSALSGLCDDAERLLAARGKLDDDIRSGIERFKGELTQIRDASVPVCAVHGDYDLYNLKIIDGEIFIFDWEHFTEEGSPFFDLSNLLFGGLAHFIVNNDLSILNSPEVIIFLKDALTFYHEKSGMPKEILKLIGPISVMEHQKRHYPYYRKPETYPLYRDDFLKFLLKWRIEL